MDPLRFAVVGTGFWAHYQTAAWQELPGADLVAVCDRNTTAGATFAKKFGVSKVYDNIEALLQHERLDFIDIVADVESHLALTKAAAMKGVDVVCQKPIAVSLNDAEEMLKICREQQVKLLIHENFRWQAPVRALKNALASGSIGTPFKARLSFCSAFPVFENQPVLAELQHFILTDIGSHILDICRYLFGEVESLTCLTQRVNKKIKGEDVATALMKMRNGLHCIAEMSYASILEKESFPETLALIEGEHGSIELSHHFELRTTTRSGTTSCIIEPQLHDWADPNYLVVHSSIVDCNRDILNGLRGGECETTGDDNIRTVRLVWACYESALHQKQVHL
jgi:D-apiose dehydrogenase